MHIYTRDQWNARPAGSMAGQGSPREAFLHHTDDPSGREYRTLTAQRAKMREIQRFHMDERGWSDIGYHFIIFQFLGKKDVRVEPRVFQARPVKFVPAAQQGHNTGTLAICVVGNGVRENLYDATDEMVAALIKRYPSVKTLGGHGDVFGTECPGREFRKSIPRIAKLAGVKVFAR